jgi:hypothetical protein
MPRNRARPLSLSQSAVGISTPSGSGRDIDTFGALHKSLRTAAIASLKDRVAARSFALGMLRGRSRAKGSARPASPEGKAGGDFGIGRPRRCATSPHSHRVDSNRRADSNRRGSRTPHPPRPLPGDRKPLQQWQVQGRTHHNAGSADNARNSAACSSEPVRHARVQPPILQTLKKCSLGLPKPLPSWKAQRARSKLHPQNRA